MEDGSVASCRRTRRQPAVTVRHREYVVRRRTDVNQTSAEATQPHVITVQTVARTSFLAYLLSTY